MVKIDLDKELNNALEGKKTNNPGYKNPDIAKEIANMYKAEQTKDYIINDEKKKILSKVITQYFGMKDLAIQILRYQPLYFDKTKMWWYWDEDLCCWQITDETNIMNMVSDLANINTVRSKDRAEILEALRQESRKKKKKKPKRTWVQFKKTIIDITTGEMFETSPYYFITNPMPWNLGENGETPMMDKIFEEWVGKAHVKKLYEIIAYCCLCNYPINRIFCFIGSGMNGKSKFLDLIRKFIGINNCCSTELDILLSSRFEVTRLHKKLVCMMGETNFNEMSKTSMIKKLSGGDLIGFEYKGKDHFEDINYAKLLISTNNLPTTTDKTIGFYRRWMIIDFPNQFTEKKEILEDIPEEEYNNLAFKCAFMLKELLTKREFDNEGSIEDRMEKYESKSNFLGKFIKQFTSEAFELYITKSDFSRKFNDWAKENGHRNMSETSLGVAMKKLNIDGGRKHFDWLHDGKGGQARVWLGIKWKE